METFDTRIIWILVVWLMPVWWATFLLVVAWLGDVYPSMRGFASRLFDYLETLTGRDQHPAPVAGGPAGV